MPEPVRIGEASGDTGTYDPLMCLFRFRQPELEVDPAVDELPTSCEKEVVADRVTAEPRDEQRQEDLVTA